MSSSQNEVNFDLLKNMETRIKITEEAGEIQSQMTDWMELAFSVEIMMVKSQLKFIKELDDTTLLDLSDEVYGQLTNLITVKYEIVQAQYDKVTNQLSDMRIEEFNKKNNNNKVSELKSTFQAFKNAWNKAKGELNGGLLECLQKFEKLLDEFKRMTSSTSGEI